MYKVVFISGTRADYGKIKPLISSLDSEKEFQLGIFVTGMHLLTRYGQTWNHINHDFGHLQIWPYPNQEEGERAERIFCRTVLGISETIHSFEPNLLVVHGDRTEALAGAVAGLFTNTLVAHIEGGEVSGTQDEMIRHSVSKLSDLHFVANLNAKKRLTQMGENPDRIFEIGSPEVDLMLSDSLPSLGDTLMRYEIPFEQYAILIFHPVSTEQNSLLRQTEQVMEFAVTSKDNFVVIETNNDPGSQIIRSTFQKYRDVNSLKFIPSMRFEYFATLLKNAQYIVGNSSSGVREAQLFGVPCVNLGSRQNGRVLSENVINSSTEVNEIFKARENALSLPRIVSRVFGTGNSSNTFKSILKDLVNMQISKQKNFLDVKVL